MKKIILLVLFLTPLASFSQSEDYRHDVPDTSVYIPDTLTLSSLSVLYVIDTTLEAPSFYLHRAANAQKFELYSYAAGGCFALLGAYLTKQEAVYNEAYSLPPSTSSQTSPLYVVAGLCGVLGLVNHFVAIVNLDKASKSLSRIHLQSNGLTIDL